MEAKPLASCVQRNEEHRVPFQLFENELGTRLVRQMGHQVRRHRVQHGDVKKEFTTIVRLGLEHLFAEVVRYQPVVPTELNDELVRIVVESEGHARQLESGGPPFRPGDQGGHAVGSDGPTGDLLEQKGRVDLVEGKIGLAQLGQFLVQSVTAPGNWEIGSAGQHQMNIGWKKVDEATQIGDKCGI